MSQPTAPPGSGGNPGAIASSRTTVALNLRVEHVPKQNLVWAAGMAVAWKELVALAGGPIVLADGDAGDPAATTVRTLNESPIDRAVLDGAPCVARAGFQSEAFLEQLRGEVARQLGDGVVADVPTDPAPELFIAYAHLAHRMAFELPLYRASWPLQFRGCVVQSFGLWEKDPAEWDALTRQVRVHHPCYTEADIERMSDAEYDVMYDESVVELLTGSLTIAWSSPSWRPGAPFGDTVERGGLVDSAGRHVRVRRHADGHIAAFEVDGGSGQYVAFRRYDYAGDDLVGATDGEGHRMSYAYDAEHRLVEQRYATGLTVSYRYDARGRCRETWTATPGSGPDGRDPALADDLPAVLADGFTPARGVLHCRFEYGPDFTEVVDSKQARRYEGNAFGKVDKVASGAGVATSTYDARGNRTSYADAANAQTIYARDASGRLTGVTDPCGGHMSFERNARGNEVSSTDALGGTVQYTYDAVSAMTEARDDLGTIIRYEYDERVKRIRATLPNGAVTHFRYDPQGNLVELVEPNGRPRQLRIDGLGRVIAFTDEEGYETRFSYNGRGQLRFVLMPNGGRQELDYDADGRLTLICNADGQAYRFFWGGFHAVHAVAKPDGTSFHLRYDRENNLVRVLNEAGKSHDMVRDVSGRIVEEKTFDGIRSADPVVTPGPAAGRSDGWQRQRSGGGG